MAKQIKSINIRFNLSKPKHAKAWEYLIDMDKEKFKSYTNMAVLAIIEYCERNNKLEQDPYLETRERENAFVNQIVDAVKTELNLALSEILLFKTQGQGQEQTTTTKKEKVIDESLVDWDFMG